MGKKIEYTIEKEESAAVFLSNVVAGLSRSKADRLVKSGEVRVNGAKIKSNVILKSGDVLSAFVPDSLVQQVQAEVIFEDDNIVVFDKPKRVSYDALPEIYGKTLFPVHRLDTNTTGLIIFAKTKETGDELVRAFRERRTKKVYEAVVSPPPVKDEAVLKAYTIMNDKNIAVVSDEYKKDYKTIITEYKVLKRFGNAAALLSVSPHTGRTHQIRAHMKFIGCPIVGDGKYGGDRKLVGAPDTQMLAAVELMFFDLKNGLEYLNGRKFGTICKFDLSFLS